MSKIFPIITCHAVDIIKILIYSRFGHSFLVSSVLSLGECMKSLCNKIMLITYPDSLGGNLAELKRILRIHFCQAIAGIHILPFFPSTGDRGFSPKTYDIVDPAFGDWEHIEQLADEYYLMCDIMINHISRQSYEFSDYIQNGNNSPYSKMFISFYDFWGNELSDADFQMLYRRKTGLPITKAELASGETAILWSSFSDDQIDLDTTQHVTRQYILSTLAHLAKHGFSLIRLDAYGYVTKVRNTNCFFVEPEIWELVKYCQQALDHDNVYLLPEVHDRYDTIQKIADHGYWTYDFVLPLLLLHTLYSGSTRELIKWHSICPRRQFTVLDTHDGIGVYDASGILSDEQASAVIAKIENKLSYSYKPIDVAKKEFFRSYQLYGTYYSLLQENDDAYLLARAIQFFSPGIPQVYYVGLLADVNDLNFPQTDHRFINRQNFTHQDIEKHVMRPVVQELLKLMSIRNSHKAFDGDIHTCDNNYGELVIERWTDFAHISLIANLKTYHFRIEDGQLGELYSN
jgi:sucrose phosphorylase